MGKAKPAAVIETLADLTPDPRNARRHNPRNVGMLEKALGEVGAARSIVIDENGVVLAGNATIEAAGRAGIERVQVVDADGETIIAVRRTGLTAAQKTRLALYDNRTAELADWDADVIADLMANERAMLDGLFENDELAELIDDLGEPEMADAEPQIDRAAELNKKWQVQAGDLWRVGDHRLLCGDSTKREDVERLMGGEKAQLCFTSPPYWVGKSYETQTSLQEIKKFVVNIAEALCSGMNRDGGRIVINTSTASATAINPKASTETLFALAWWQDALRDRDWLMRHCRLWVKRGQLAAPRVAARSDVIDQHWETVATFLPTFYCPEGLRRGQEKIGMKWAQQGVWDDIHGQANMAEHGAAFPLELPMRYMKLYSINAEIVLEPFMGTGTTMVACENLKRKCRGIEISPDYCAVILERMATAFPALAIERA